jgi:hypothetical protein
MRFEIVAALLHLVAVQATAIPAAFPEPEPQLGGGASIGVPRMITPKYRSTAKRAIIRYPAFTLQAKGVCDPTSLRTDTKRLIGHRKVVVSPWTPMAKVEF